METRNDSSEFSIHGDDKKKKKGKGSGATHVFRVALYMMRRKRNQPSKSKLHPTIWRRIVGSIRPLHSSEIPTTPPPQAKITKIPSSKTTTFPMAEEEEEVEEAFTPLVSPFPSSSSTSGTSSMGTDSRYASALNLKEMDQCDDDDDDDDDDGGGHGDGDGGDDMIDAKAAEFIARFYTQMRLQN